MVTALSQRRPSAVSSIHSTTARRRFPPNPVRGVVGGGKRLVHDLGRRHRGHAGQAILGGDAAHGGADILRGWSQRAAGQTLAEPFAADHLQQADPLAVVGNEARGVQSGEKGVAGPSAGLLAADEGFAGQQGRDHREPGVAFEPPAEGADIVCESLATVAAGHGGTAGRRCGRTDRPHLLAVTAQGGERIFPQARLDTGIRKH
jgi:hypothetical protein